MGELNPSETYQAITATVQTICAVVMLVFGLWGPVRKWLRRRAGKEASASPATVTPAPLGSRRLLRQYRRTQSVSAGSAPQVKGYSGPSRREWALLTGGVATALLVALYVKAIWAANRDDMVVELVITAAIGLALASSLYLGSRAPSLWVPVLLLAMLVSLVVSVTVGGFYPGPLEPLWRVAGSFMPIATVYLACRSRRPMYQGAIFAFGLIYTVGQPLMYSFVTTGMLLFFAATRPRREVWKVLFFPAIAVVTGIVTIGIRESRFNSLYDRINEWRPGGSPDFWSWQIDRYLDVLSGAAPFGAGTVQLVPQAGRTGWFIALTAHLGIVPAIAILTVLAVTFWRITLHSVRLIRQRPHSFVLAGMLLPLLAVSLAVQLGLIPVFGVAPPPFNTMASGPLWLALALCATRWPVLQDVNARTLRPGQGVPRAGRDA